MDRGVYGGTAGVKATDSDIKRFIEGLKVTGTTPWNSNHHSGQCPFIRCREYVSESYNFCPKCGTRLLWSHKKDGIGVNL